MRPTMIHSIENLSNIQRECNETRVDTIPAVAMVDKNLTSTVEAIWQMSAPVSWSMNPSLKESHTDLCATLICYKANNVVAVCND